MIKLVKHPKAEDRLITTEDLLPPGFWRGGVRGHGDMLFLVTNEHTGLNRCMIFFEDTKTRTVKLVAGEQVNVVPVRAELHVYTE